MSTGPVLVATSAAICTSKRSTSQGRRTFPCGCECVFPIPPGLRAAAKFYGNVTCVTGPPSERGTIHELGGVETAMNTPLCPMCSRVLKISTIEPHPTRICIDRHVCRYVGDFSLLHEACRGHPSRRRVRSITVTSAAAIPSICFCDAQRRPFMTARHPGRRRPIFARRQFAIA